MATSWLALLILVLVLASSRRQSTSIPQLKVNTKKIQVLRMNTANCDPILFSNKPLEDTEEFTYLGNKVTTTGMKGKTIQQTARTRKRSSGTGAFDQEKQQYYSFLGISNPFPPRTREQQSKSDGTLAVTLPPLTSCRKMSNHCHTEKRRVSASTGPPEGVLRKASKETKKMLQELDKNLIESEPVEQTITDLPERTPEPEILHDFPELRSGSVSKPERIRRHSSYEPRYCWCTRCQIMYRLYKDNDHSLEGWGKYPCFHL